jgi:hypothetical protein
VSAVFALARTVGSDIRSRTAMSAAAARTARSRRSRRTCDVDRPRGSVHAASRVGSGPTHGSGSDSASRSSCAIAEYCCATSTRARAWASSSCVSASRGASTAASGSAGRTRYSSGSTLIMSAGSIMSCRAASSSRPRGRPAYSGVDLFILRV